ncbi:rod shape-determining protein [Candidatus Parcubacteria bacterium]|nr:rod shape-determining protein [Candidatus Parcubacteria bacterium]
MFSPKIGIDLGTCNSAVFLPKKGVVLNEPSVVAISIPENKILAVGQEAKEMLGKTPEIVRVFRPLKDGVIADFKVTRAMLSYFFDKVLGKFRIFKPEVVVGIPAGATSTEKRALIEAGLGAGAKQVFVVKEPILAALGAGVPIEGAFGNLICDIGGGTTEVAVISLGGVVVFRSIRMAGDKMDSAIVDYIKKKYNLAIGEQTAEEIKIKIGTALPEKDPKWLEIKGRDLVSGLPRTIKISSNEVQEAISDILNEIVQVIKLTLRETPPELAADLYDKGIVLTGGSSLLRNLPHFIQKQIGIPAILAEDPQLCVARGTGVILESLDHYKKVISEKLPSKK